MSDNDHSSLNLTEAKEEEVSEIVDTKRNSAMWFFRNLGGRRSNQFHTLIKMLVTTEIIFLCSETEQCTLPENEKTNSVSISI